MTTLSTKYFEIESNHIDAIPTAAHYEALGGINMILVNPPNVSVFRIRNPFPLLNIRDKNGYIRKFGSAPLCVSLPSIQDISVDHSSNSLVAHADNVE